MEVRKDAIPEVCMMSSMTDQNLSRTHDHYSGVKHFQVLNPCKLSLQEKQQK